MEYVDLNFLHLAKPELAIIGEVPFFPTPFFPF